MGHNEYSIVHVFALLFLYVFAGLAVLLIARAPSTHVYG